MTIESDYVEWGGDVEARFSFEILHRISVLILEKEVYLYAILFIYVP